MKVQEKLAAFSQAALKEAEDQRSRLLEELRAEYNAACDSLAAQAKKDCEEILRRETAGAEQSKNKEILLASNEARKALAARREQLLDQLFERLEQKLAAYAVTDDYKEKLRRDIASRYDACHSPMLVTIRQQDGDIQASFPERPEIVFQLSDADMIGGFTALVKAQNLLINESLREKLNEARQAFIGFNIA
ncbi:MAG: V-type ATP synthase subunit E [Peptococcaceae bacterium]|jgi:vacuolar-type H+-ATPase subunit E/Vma4|nr:V-type ATP synthase subunit E [Peptococcaceae bacterium]